MHIMAKPLFRDTLCQLGLICLTSISSTLFAEIKFSGELEAELRIYPQKGLHTEQKQAYLSAALQPRFDWKHENNAHRIRIEPFARASIPDGNRTHADLREAYYQYNGRQWQFKAGVSKVFWGVVESYHLVDVINQADVLESPTGTEKLGQPMISAGVEQAFGNIDFYLLPYFRHKAFASERERFQISPGSSFEEFEDSVEIKYHSSKAFYQSRHKENHIDSAVRWAHYIDDFDLALSAFNGTSREAIPVPYHVDINTSNTPRGKFASWYEQTTQLSLEAQYLHNEWAFKLESVYHRQDSGNYTAAVTGLEYTFRDIGTHGSDIGLLLEYLWHDRKDISIRKSSQQVLDADIFELIDNASLFDNKIPGDYLTPFDNDIFLGTRFALNNIAGTEFLAGVIVDADNQTTLASFEGSTRIGDSMRAALNIYYSASKKKTSTFYPFRKDSQLELKLNWYF